MRQSQKTLALWAFLVLVGVMLYHLYDHRATTMIPDFNFSKFIKAVQAGDVQDLTFRDNGEILGEVKPETEAKYHGKQFHITGNTGDEVFKIVMSAGIIPNYENTERTSFMHALFVNWLPLVFIFVMFLLFMRQIQAGGGGALTLAMEHQELILEPLTSISNLGSISMILPSF